MLGVQHQMQNILQLVLRLHRFEGSLISSCLSLEVMLNHNCWSYTAKPSKFDKEINSIVFIEQYLHNNFIAASCTFHQ